MGTNSENLHDLAHDVSIRAIITYWGLELKSAGGKNFASVLGGGSHALHIRDDDRAWVDFSATFGANLRPKAGNQYVGGDSIDLVGYLKWVYNGEEYLGANGEPIRERETAARNWILQNICKINDVQINISKQDKPASSLKTDYSQLSVQRNIHPNLVSYLTDSRALSKEVVKRFFVQLNRGIRQDGTPATFGVFTPNILCTRHTPSGEFRNNLSAYNKLTIGPKNISCLYSDWTWRTGGAQHVAHSGNLLVVEGMITGASFIDLTGNPNENLTYDLLILNSANQASRTHELIAHYNKVLCLCDADVEGDKATMTIKDYVDEHNEYCKEQGIDDMVNFSDLRYMLIKDGMEEKFDSQMPALQQQLYLNEAEGVTDQSLKDSIQNLYAETCFNDVNDLLKDTVYQEKLEKINSKSKGI